MKSIRNWTLKRVVILIPLVGLFLTCKKDEPYVFICQDGEVEFENGSFGLKNVSDTVRVVNLTIQTEPEYLHFVTSRFSLPKIDFARKTVLIGRSYSPTRSIVLSQRVISDCIKGEITYEVLMKYGVAAISGTTAYSVIIPKIPDSTKVKFVVIYQ